MAQLALVLRYLTVTGVQECFVKFVDVTNGRQADDFATPIFHFFGKYECCLDKVVALCYDGTVVMNGVQTEAKEKAPRTGMSN